MLWQGADGVLSTGTRRLASSMQVHASVRPCHHLDGCQKKFAVGGCVVNKRRDVREAKELLEADRQALRALQEVPRGDEDAS